MARPPDTDHVHLTHEFAPETGLDECCSRRNYSTASDRTRSEAGTARVHERGDVKDLTARASRDLAIGLYLTSSCCLELVVELCELPPFSGVAATSVVLCLASALRGLARRRRS